MNDIPRYRPVSNDRYGITDDVDGKLCEYRDYARLKAEVERLNAMANECEHLHKGIYSLSLNVLQLKAEVERLREAGDALAAWTLTLEHTYDHKPMDGLPFSSFLCAWHNAAKEGKGQP